MQSQDMAAKSDTPQSRRDRNTQEADMDHDTIVDDWRKNAERHDDENYEFLRSMKFRDYGFDPDELAGELHEQMKRRALG
jgi:hypothetical protein